MHSIAWNSWKLWISCLIFTYVSLLVIRNTKARHCVFSDAASSTSASVLRKAFFLNNSIASLNHSNGKGSSHENVSCIRSSKTQSCTAREAGGCLLVLLLPNLGGAFSFRLEVAAILSESFLHLSRAWIIQDLTVLFFSGGGGSSAEATAGRAVVVSVLRPDVWISLHKNATMVHGRSSHSPRPPWLLLRWWENRKSFLLIGKKESHNENGVIHGNTQQWNSFSLYISLS